MRLFSRLIVVSLTTLSIFSIFSIFSLSLNKSLIVPINAPPNSAMAQGAPTNPARASAPSSVLTGQTAGNTQGNASLMQTGLTLSLPDAIRMAQERSYTSQQYDARAVGAGARAAGAGKLLNPVISIAGHFGNNAAGTDEDYLISQSFELGDKRNQRIRAARADREAATTDRLAARNDLVFSVQSAYYEAQRAESEYQLAQNALTNAQKFAEAARLQFTAGDVARSQVTRSRIEQSRAEQALTVAETERSNRLAALRSLLHMPESGPIKLGTDLAFTPVNFKLSDLTAYALAHRPDLQSDMSLLASKEALLHSSRAQSQPDLFVEARHSNIDPTLGGNTLRIGVLFPFIDYGRNRADSASARAAVVEQEAILSEARRVALLEVETAYRNLEQARRTIESFQGGRLNDSRELVDQAQIGYAQGANTFLELIDAQQVYRAEQTDYTRALAAYNIALAALQRSLGGQLP